MARGWPPRGAADAPWSRAWGCVARRRLAGSRSKGAVAVARSAGTAVAVEGGDVRARAAARSVAAVAGRDRRAYPAAVGLPDLQHRDLGAVVLPRHPGRDAR